MTDWQPINSLYMEEEIVVYGRLYIYNLTLFGKRKDDGEYPHLEIWAVPWNWEKSGEFLGRPKLAKSFKAQYAEFKPTHWWKIPEPYPVLTKRQRMLDQVVREWLTKANMILCLSENYVRPIDRMNIRTAFRRILAEQDNPQAE